jgi:hypothetical protein
MAIDEFLNPLYRSEHCLRPISSSGNKNQAREVQPQYVCSRDYVCSSITARSIAVATDIVRDGLSDHRP